MYKIGEFSKIVDIPVRTLRYYAEIGIVIPSEIDKFTGYRYYSDDNINECEMIKLLRNLDFSLEEIKTYKDCLDKNILENKKKEIADKIYLLQLKLNKITLIQQDLGISRVKKIAEESDEEENLRRKYEKGIIRKDF
jgi:DNA-binding transcriptional MerR regulator